MSQIKSCPVYLEKAETKYIEHIYSAKEYNLNIKMNDESNNINDLNLSLSDNFELIAKLNGSFEEHVLNLKNVFSIATFENNNTYEIIILAFDDEGNTISYLSHFLNKTASYDVNDMYDKLNDSFEQIMIPATIKEIGYYEEVGNTYKYPLYVSSTKTRYIVSQDGTIYKYL